jgi:hypothetical protein
MPPFPTNEEALQNALDGLNVAVADLCLAAEIAKTTEHLTVEQAKNPNGGLMLRVTHPDGTVKILR